MPLTLQSEETLPGHLNNPIDYTSLNPKEITGTRTWVTNPLMAGGKIEMYKEFNGWLMVPGQTILTIGDGSTVIHTLTGLSNIATRVLLETLLGFSVPTMILDNDSRINYLLTIDYKFPDGSISAKAISGSNNSLYKSVDGQGVSTYGVSIGCSANCILKTYQISLVTI